MNQKKKHTNTLSLDQPVIWWKDAKKETNAPKILMTTKKDNLMELFSMLSKFFIFFNGGF